MGGHSARFRQEHGELIKTTSSIEANFYECHGQALREILPRFRLLDKPLVDLRKSRSTDVEIAFEPVGANLLDATQNASEKYPPGAQLQGLKYMDVKVGSGFNAYESALHYPEKWGCLTADARSQKIQRRLDKEAAYDQSQRGFRVVNYTGAPTLPLITDAVTLDYLSSGNNAVKRRRLGERIALANQSNSLSFHGFFEGDIKAIRAAQKTIVQMHECLKPLSKRAALGFVSTSVLFAYNPKAPGRVDAKLIDFAHYLKADIFSSATHCAETAVVRNAFLSGMLKLALALRSSADVLETVSDR